MDNKELQNGMYIIDKEYSIVAMNRITRDSFPKANVGDKCYSAFALSKKPCEICPLKNDHVLFYSEPRKEWITASAALVDMPQFGECYCIQYRRQYNKGGTKREQIRLEKVDEYIEEINGAVTGKECVLAGYCEPGSPIFYANEQMVALLGYESLDELVYSSDGLIVNLMHPDDRIQIKQEMKCLDPCEKFFDLTFRMRKKDDSWVWMVSKGMTIKTSKDKMVTLCVCTDINVLLKLQNSLQTRNRELLEKQEQRESLLLQIPGGYHRCGIDDGFPFLYISESFQKIVGWNKKEIETLFDNKFLNLVWEEDLHIFDNLLNQINNKGHGSTVYRIKKKGGGYKWVQDSTRWVENGENSSYQCSVADITEFVVNQQNLILENNEYHQKELLFERIVQSMPSGYHRCSTHDGFRISFLSDSFLDIVGWTKEEIENELDCQFINIVAPEDREKFMNLEPKLRENGRIDAVYRIHTSSGERRWIKDSTIKVEPNYGESFYQCTLADITEYVEQLNEEKRRAEASSRAKSTFLFNASHDIRTPMNAIHGFTKILKDNLGNERIVRETIEKIEKSSDTLSKLLNDVLELSRIESGKDKLENQTICLDRHSQNLYEMFAAEMTESGISFENRNFITHTNVICDPLKLSRIGMNMLSNAKKFTPYGGSVVFGIEELESDGITAVYRFYTKDSGIGMSKEFQKKAFEQFERERTSTDSGISGSGLGLAIIKKLVDLMNGECTIESDLGKGTEISAIISFEIATETVYVQNELQNDIINLSGKRVLLVEDNVFNREIARYILESAGIEVDEAENGSVAVNIMLNSEPNFYDLILMDIQMPVMDGYRATQEIRSIEDSVKASIPILAMTANAFNEDRERCLSVGMNGHIAKPVDASALLKEIFDKISSRK